MAAQQKGAGKLGARKRGGHQKISQLHFFYLLRDTCTMARAIAAFVGAMAATSAAQDCFYNFGNSSFNLLPYQAQP